MTATSLDQIRERLAMRFGDIHIATTSTDAAGIVGIPDGWADIVGECDATVRSRVAEWWRAAAPMLPRIAELIERELRHIWVTEIDARLHYLNSFEYGDVENWPGFGEREIVMIYLFPDRHHPDRLEARIAGPPYVGPLPSWWDATIPVLGRLATTVHDGFMDPHQWYGLLSVANVHTVHDRLIRWVDPDMEDMNVYVPDVDGAGETELVRTEWPDFSRLIVLAENMTWEAWAVDTTGARSGWEGGSDYFCPVDDIAAAIDDEIVGMLAPADEEAAENPRLAVNASMSDVPRAPVFATTAVAAATLLAGPGAEAIRAVASERLVGLDTMTTPDGFARLSDGFGRLRAIARAQWPPGIRFESNVPVAERVSVDDESLSNMRVQMFRSTRTVISVVAFEAPPDTGFGVGGDQFAVSFADDRGDVRGFAVRGDIDPVDGSDEVAGLTMILTGGGSNRAFNQFVHAARIDSTLRVLVIVAPEFGCDEWTPVVNSNLAPLVVADAVAALRRIEADCE